MSCTKTYRGPESTHTSQFGKPCLKSLGFLLRATGESYNGRMWGRDMVKYTLYHSDSSEARAGPGCMRELGAKTPAGVCCQNQVRGGNGLN